MIKMVTKQNIIHWHMSGMSQRSIARQAKVSRRTVQKVLREYESIRQKGNDDALEDLLTIPPRYNSKNRLPRVLTPVVKSIIQDCLQSNRRKLSMGMRKQRMLKRDIWEYLHEQGYFLSYSSVCHYIYALEHRPVEREKEAYIRQEYYAGEICEFDWGEVKLFIAGKEERFYLAVFTFAYSNARWAYLFHHQDTLAFMESHRNFFRDIHGVPGMMVYDNMRVAVKAFVEKDKLPTDALLRMCL
jgi:transposase